MRCENSVFEIFFNLFFNLKIVKKYSERYIPIIHKSNRGNKMKSEI